MWPAAWHFQPSGEVSVWKRLFIIIFFYLKGIVIVTGSSCENVFKCKYLEKSCFTRSEMSCNGPYTFFHEGKAWPRYSQFTRGSVVGVVHLFYCQFAAMAGLFCVGIDPLLYLQKLFCLRWRIAMFEVTFFQIGHKMQQIYSSRVAHACLECPSSFCSPFSLFIFGSQSTTTLECKLCQRSINVTILKSHLDVCSLRYGSFCSILPHAWTLTVHSCCYSWS